MKFRQNVLCSSILEVNELYLELLYNLGKCFQNIAKVGINKMEANNHQR